QIEAGRASMIMMDDPEHTRLRKIVSRGFTPRAVERLRAELGAKPLDGTRRETARDNFAQSGVFGVVHHDHRGSAGLDLT
ncbi:hypothetical protein C6A85_07910, partial [Mycobacterium sp. ITM-2017-0098]